MRKFLFAATLILSLLAMAQITFAGPKPKGQYLPGNTQAPAVEIEIPNPVSSRPGGLAVTFSAVLQVEEPEKAAGRVVACAESLGGWFTSRSKTELQLRIPTQKADEFFASLPKLGVLLDRNLSTLSLAGEREELLHRLKARKATLNDYFAMLKESGDSTVFTIQSEIVNLQEEIEQTTGQVEKLQDRMAYAQATVDFRFQERGAPLATGISRFPWLNRLGLPNMRERFRYDSK